MSEKQKKPALVVSMAEHKAKAEKKKREEALARIYKAAKELNW